MLIEQDIGNHCVDNGCHSLHKTEFEKVERTQKYVRAKVQNDIRMPTHIYEQTSIPDFQLCYP